MRLLLMGGGCALAMSAPALAQQNQVSTVEQVIVTAQKRSENVQTVPLSVTPLTGATIERLHVQDLKDITGTIPNVQVQVNGGLSLSASYVIRGIGIAANPSPYVGTEVGTVIDGVVQSVNELGLSDQFDVDRLEVLRGPQGTLFGANTTGGVINIITRQPTGKFGGYGQFTVGNYGRLDGSVAVNFPIIEDVLAGKIAISHRGRDGYYTNLYTGEDLGHINSTQLRAYLRWTPTSDLDVTWIGDVRRIRNGTDVLVDIAYPGEIFFRPDTPRDFKLYSDVPDRHDSDVFGNTVTANWSSPIGKVTSITNYATWKSYGFQDVDGIDCFCYAQVGKDEGWQMSQELRDVFHPTDTLEVLVGGFAQAWGYTSNGQGWPAFSSDQVVSVNRAKQRSSNLSAFSQVYWDVTERLRLQFGVRVSHEKVRMAEAALTYIQPNGTNPALGQGNLVGAILQPLNPANLPTEASKSWTNFGGKVGADFKVTDDVMLYGYYARGFKSGGFNGRVTSSTDIGPYDPEFVNSYEVGLKSQLFDRRLKFNVSAFLNKWSDMQVNQVLYRGNPPQASSTILNAAEATTKGVEVETEFVPVHGLRLNASVGYLQANYDKFSSGSGPACPALPAPQPAGCSTDYSGRDLVYSPKWNGSFSASYNFPLAGGDMDATAQYTFNGQRWGNYTQAPSELLKAVSLLNATVSWAPHDANWSVAVWGRNLTNRKYLSLALDAPPLFTEGLFGNPREFGVDVKFNF